MFGFTGMSYSSPSEEAHRMQIWLDNRRLVLVHNMLADQGIKSYRLGMTEFADMVCTGKQQRSCFLHSLECILFHSPCTLLTPSHFTRTMKSTNAWFPAVAWVPSMFRCLARALLFSGCLAPQICPSLLTGGRRDMSPVSRIRRSVAPAGPLVQYVHQ